MTTASAPELTDDALRKLWRDNGGDFFGPHVETGKMPESKLLPFLRSLSAQAAKPFAWVLPGDDNARDDGWLDARIDRQGEFTKPLYTSAPRGDFRAGIEAAALLHVDESADVDVEFISQAKIDALPEGEYTLYLAPEQPVEDAPTNQQIVEQAYGLPMEWVKDTPDAPAGGLLKEARDALDRVANLIHHQYTGSKEGMTALQIASDLADALVKRIDAAGSAPADKNAHRE
jgi:hypothetical protein